MFLCSAFLQCCASAACSEDELALGHCADGHQEVLEGDDLLRRDDVVANVQALDVTLLKGICELLDIVHYNEVVADVEIFERRVLLSNHFAQLRGRLARQLSVRQVANFDASGGKQSLRNDQTGIVTNLVIIVEADLLQAWADGQ